jgi:HEXXH motif-containing protein
MPSAAAGFDVSEELLRCLASTRPTARQAALLHAGLHSRRLVLLKALLVRLEREDVPLAVRRRFHRDWRLLESAERRSPQAVRHALAYPSVGNRLFRWLGAPLGDRSALTGFPGDFGALAAVAALRAGLPFARTLPVPSGCLVLPGTGAYATRSDRVRLVAGPRGLRLSSPGRPRATVVSRPLSGREAAGWRGVQTLPGGFAVLDDVDPYRFPHRDGALFRTGVLSAQAQQEWRARWSAALALLTSVDPLRRREVRTFVRSVVPRSEGGGESATAGSAPWCVVTGLPARAGSLASVLVHEVQHSKLAVFSDMVPLCEPGGAAEHRVAWRRDPRPVGSVLQGTYAHLALADLWGRMARRPGATPVSTVAARRRAAGYREQVADALAVLRKSGELTMQGYEFVAAMTHRHGSL